jgi:hypothetical protein
MRTAVPQLDHRSSLSERLLTLVIPSAVIAVLLVNALHDGYFRDEFYYLACARRLAWGYVDHPPFSVALLALVTAIFGDSLLVLRAAAAVMAAGTVWLTGRLTRRLGAGMPGMALAMVSAAIAPVLIGTATFYSMNVLEILIWTLVAHQFLTVLERPTTAAWMVLGMLLGIGLLNKISVLWLGAGLGAGILIWRRDLLAARGPWLAAAIACACFVPHVVWQIANGWPTLEFIRNASAGKMQENTAVQFLADQVKNAHPITAPVWLGGLWFLLGSKRGRAYRPLACLYLVPLVILVLNRTSRSSYLAPAYPLLFAAGGAALEPIVFTPLRLAVVLITVASAGLATLPLAVPLLPPDRYVEYAAAFGEAPSTEEKKEVARLPQFFADRNGWPELAAAVAEAWRRLPPAERAHAAVITGNYGEAGAIEHFAPEVRVMSGHNNYWLWGYGDEPIDTLLVLSRSRERQLERFATVEEVGRTACGDCMPYENGLTIFIGRGLREPMPQLWTQLRHFD